MVDMRPNRQIGYILRSFPRLSQTFIVNEILALQQAGVDIQIYAITNPHEQIVQQQVKDVKAPVLYFENRNMRSPQEEHFSVLHAYGEGYLRALLKVLSSSKIDKGYRSANRFECFNYAVRLVNHLQQMQHETGQVIEHLHAHFAHDPTLIAQLAHLMTGLPFSFTAHARDLYQIHGEILRNRIHQAQSVVTCCYANLEYLRNIAPDERGKFSLVYHGVNLQGFQPPVRNEQHTHTPLILSVGRLVEKKGFFDLFEALARVKAQGWRFYCQVYGDGPLKPALEQWIEEHNMKEEIVLAGSRTQQDLIPIYQRADIFALTPIVGEDGDRDGVPNVLVEAMAIGLPVVTTCVGGINELVEHSLTGLLYSPLNVDGITEGIMNLLQHEDLRARLGQAGRRCVVERFDVRQAASQLKRLFAEAV